MSGLNPFQPNLFFLVQKIQLMRAIEGFLTGNAGDICPVLEKTGIPVCFRWFV